MNEIDRLRQLYREDRISAAKIARRIQRRKSTIHSALTRDGDIGYCLVIEMAQAADAILAEEASQSRPQSTPAVA